MKKTSKEKTEKTLTGKIFSFYILHGPEKTAKMLNLPIELVKSIHKYKLWKTHCKQIIKRGQWKYIYEQKPGTGKKALNVKNTEFKQFGD
jgi:hypothetical protein